MECGSLQIKVSPYWRANEAIGSWVGGELQIRNRIFERLVIRSEQNAAGSAVSLKFPLKYNEIKISH